MSAEDAVTEEDMPKPAGGVWDRRYAYAYISLLLLVPLAAAVLAVWLGWLDGSLTLSATVNVGWVVELLVAGLAVLFLFFTAVQVVRVAGVGLTSWAIRTVARLAHSYELPGTEESNSNE